MTVYHKSEYVSFKVTAYQGKCNVSNNSRELCQIQTWNTCSCYLYMYIMSFSANNHKLVRTEVKSRGFSTSVESLYVVMNTTLIILMMYTHLHLISR